MRYAPSSGRPDLPEFPLSGARIDYYLAAPSGELKLDILDATGKVVRAYSSEGGRPATTGRGGGGRRGGGPTTLPVKPGMNRFVWDLRYDAGGPFVAPGSYKARLTSGGVVKTEPVVVRIDPRVAKDGVTVADLVEQAKFALKVRDALVDARQLQTRVRQAIDARRGDQTKLQDVWERLTTKPGPYEDAMFIDQMSNVSREINQADQKVGASAFERFTELMKEWTALKADADRALQ
jgi:hypothetical protein